MPRKKAGKSEKTVSASGKSTKRGAAGSKLADKDVDEPDPKDEFFPVVGIGASAGGLEAFSKLLENLPADTGMAYVFVQHLAPEHHSLLSNLLSKKTPMKVAEVEDGMEVIPNHIYVIPPNTNMAILHRKLILMPRDDANEKHMPVDYFLYSLARDHGSRSMGVVLSGTASDGALGLKAIKAAGGITFAQDENTAKYYGMPRSAIAAGYVDFIMSPEAIARELARIGKHPYLNRTSVVKKAKGTPMVEGVLNKIIILLRDRSGVDFTYYKQTTLSRRISRRMLLHKIESSGSYLKYLNEEPDELRELYNDILINVTGFFRDPEVFDALERDIFPKITERRSQESPIRIWVPGCSTGEEPYSIAILLHEFLGDMATNTQIQIFATDISEKSIEKARAGVYLENLVADVSPERLHRFFVKVENGYQISNAIRDMCVFARQDIIKDPPFSKLDLISCRNVLIYLGSVLQKKVVPIFFHALKPEGFLLLGTSETIGEFSTLFALRDRKHKIYVKKSSVEKLRFDFVNQDYTPRNAMKAIPEAGEPNPGLNLERAADRVVLSRYAPAGVIINDNMEILHFRGRTGSYLEPAAGEASLNILRMAREGLLLDLRAAIHNVRKKGAPVRKEGVKIRYNGKGLEINLEVIPILPAKAADYFYLVLFEDVSPLEKVKTRSSDSPKGKKEKNPGMDDEINTLKRELAANKDYLQSIIEEQEATNEELRSANEEIQSSNEELQSTNEELETAKEELQSTNEELTTVNEEMENRNVELSVVNSDLSNLISSVHIPVIMLGPDLGIRRFTPMAEKLLNVIPADIGRKITNINPNFDIPDLQQLILDVLDTLRIEEREIQDHEGHWYSMRIRPYKTTHNKIDGVTITFLDINATKHTEETLVASGLLMRSIVGSLPIGVSTIDEKGNLLTFNRAAEKMFGYRASDISGQSGLILIADVSQKKYKNIIAGYLKKDETDITKIVLSGKSKDDAIFPIELTITDMKLASRKVLSLVVRQVEIPG